MDPAQVQSAIFSIGICPGCHREVNNASYIKHSRCNLRGRATCVPHNDVSAIPQIQLG
jgi:hypothetical protein